MIPPSKRGNGIPKTDVDALMEQLSPDNFNSESAPEVLLSAEDVAHLSFPKSLKSDTLKAAGCVESKHKESVASMEWVDPDKLICKKCQHCWRTVGYELAPNRKADGSPFMTRDGFCTVLPHSIVPLEDRYTIECSFFKPKGILNQIKWTLGMILTRGEIK